MADILVERLAHVVRHHVILLGFLFRPFNLDDRLAGLRILLLQDTLGARRLAREGDFFALGEAARGAGHEKQRHRTDHNC